MQKNRSDLWEDITTSLFSNIDQEFINTFRSPGGANSRLAAWDPLDKSMRYYKFLLFNILRNKEVSFFDNYRKLKNTEIGNPITVNVNNTDVDIDYLFSIEEYLFIQKNIELKKLKKIVEIGAGFGRTCHALLTLIDSVEEYIIVDLPEVINLSSNFLKKAIPEHFSKIRFIKNIEYLNYSYDPDLIINIDSFQEMPSVIIDDYMLNIISHSKFFYTKNPIGKYDPANVGLFGITQNQLLDVYSLGYCNDIYDLFNESILSEARKKYVKQYMPKIGEWQVINESPVEIFPYLHNVLYINQNINF